MGSTRKPPRRVIATARRQLGLAQDVWRSDRADAQVDRLLGRSMHCLVTFPAKRNQISLDIVTKCATPSQVVDIEILEAATYLTAPVVTDQDFFTQPRIREGRYWNSMPLSQDGVAHLAFSVGSDGPRVAAERRMDAEHSGPCMEFSVSKAAPSKKSAQIISSEYPRDLSLPSISAAISSARSTTDSWLLYNLK